MSIKKPRSSHAPCCVDCLLLARPHSHLRRRSPIVGEVVVLRGGFSEAEKDSMSALISDVTFTPRSSADGTWYVEVGSPSIAYQDIGDFRSKASAEAWIRDVLRSHVASAASGSATYPADAKAAAENAI